VASEFASGGGAGGAVTLGADVAGGAGDVAGDGVAALDGDVVGAGGTVPQRQPQSRSSRMASRNMVSLISSPGDSD
jgi:surface antigen